MKDNTHGNGFGVGVPKRRGLFHFIDYLSCSTPVKCYKVEYLNIKRTKSSKRAINAFEEDFIRNQK